MKTLIYPFIIFVFSNLVIAQSPGGISAGNQIWLKADQGVTGTTEVTNWSDNSGSNNHAIGDNVTVGGSGPSLAPNSINYNPSLRLDALQGLYSPSLLTASPGFIAYFVTVEDDILEPKWYFREAYSNINTMGIASRLSSHTLDNSETFLSFDRIASATRKNKIFNGKPFITTFCSGFLTQYGPNDNSPKSIDINGSSTSSPNSFLPIGTGIGESFDIGNSINAINGDNNFAQSFAGNIAEVIVYSGDQGPAELNKIESYLAVKYGITLDNSLGGIIGDYVATDGTLFWDATLTPNYHTNVIGLGRDDDENLLQKQSHTMDDTARVYLNTLQTTNAANTGNINNNISYLLVGDNKGEMNETAASNSELPLIPNFESTGRLDREWKVTKTNFSDNFNFDFTLSALATENLNTNCLYLLVDDDGDFSNGGTTYYTNNDGSGIIISNPAGIVSVRNISIAQIANNSTQYVTLASYIPDIKASDDVTICPGGSANVSAVGVGLNYSWDNGLGNGQSHAVIPAITTNYIVTGSSANGCPNTDSVLVTVNTADVFGTDTQLACTSFDWIDGNTYTANNNTATHTLLAGSISGCDSIVTLNLTINEPTNGIDFQIACGSYDWIDGITYTASNNTATHMISGGTANGCDSLVTLNLTMNSVSSSIDTHKSCEAFIWIDGNTYENSNSTATFVITGGAVNGCDSIVTLNLTILPEIVVNMGADIFFCSEESFSVTPGPDYVSYLWSNGAESPSLDVNREGEFGVTVTDEEGCTGFGEIKITEECPFSMWIPNVFTPDGDDLNNVFKIISENAVSIDVTIYNRWGETIYSWQELSGSWDGKIASGSFAKTGVYSYTVKYSYYKKGLLIKDQKLGHITLLK